MNRIEPVGPPGAYKTFQITSPISTHFRIGTCEEAGCLAHQYGWETRVDESAELGPRQAHYIRTTSGRRFAERRDADLTVFTFESGQRCFAEHKISLARPEFFVARPGDWRQLGTPHVYDQADDWVNDFGDHQARIARVVNG